MRTTMKNIEAQLPQPDFNVMTDNLNNIVRSTAELTLQVSRFPNVPAFDRQILAELRAMRAEMRFYFVATCVVFLS